MGIGSGLNRPLKHCGLLSKRTCINIYRKIRKCRKENSQPKTFF